VVRLPRDVAARKRVIALCDREVDPEHRGTLDRDVHDDKLFLWWD
jgi:hypothetical protein